MAAFLPLRALGWSRPIKVQAPPVRLADPAGDVATNALVASGLWRWDMRVGVESGASRARIEVFAPEVQQSDRDLGRQEAARIKSTITEALRAEGYAIRFSDALFCERSTKGWVVLVRAVANPHL